MAQMIAQTHWKRPDQLSIVREAGFGYKYFRKSDVERRLLEGWIVCDKDEKIMRESGSVDRSQNYRSLILMKMPDHMVKERNDYYINKHKRRLRASARGAAIDSVAGRAGTHGRDNADGSLAGAVGKGLTIAQGTKTEEGLVHTDDVHIPIGGEPTEEDTEGLRDLAEVKKAMAEEEVDLTGEEEAPRKRAKAKGGKS